MAAHSAIMLANSFNHCRPSGELNRALSAAVDSSLTLSLRPGISLARRFCAFGLGIDWIELAPEQARLAYIFLMRSNFSFPVSSTSLVIAPDGAVTKVRV
jgi:hypothetical protein